MSSRVLKALAISTLALISLVLAPYIVLSYVYRKYPQFRTEIELEVLVVLGSIIAILTFIKTLKPRISAIVGTMNSIVTLVYFLMLFKTGIICMSMGNIRIVVDMGVYKYLPIIVVVFQLITNFVKIVYTRKRRSHELWTQE